jgi:hypothetical protein
MAEEQKWPAPLVRKTFLEYFEGKQHEIGMFDNPFARMLVYVCFALVSTTFWALPASVPAHHRHPDLVIKRF